MKFSIIVAINCFNGIGYSGRIPWKSPEDMRFFVNTTRHNSVIMGRKTFESMKCRPLKNRFNVVVTSSRFDNVITTSSLLEALEKCEGKIFVIGGEQLYNEAVKMGECEEIYISKINDDNVCDTFFPYDYVKDNFKLLDVIDDISLHVEHYIKK